MVSDSSEFNDLFPDFIWTFNVMSLTVLYSSNIEISQLEWVNAITDVFSLDAGNPDLSPHSAMSLKQPIIAMTACQTAFRHI